jgi:hypothetical protein
MIENGTSPSRPGDISREDAYSKLREALIRDGLPVALLQKAATMSFLR